MLNIIAKTRHLILFLESELCLLNCLMLWSWKNKAFQHLKITFAKRFRNSRHAIIVDISKVEDYNLTCQRCKERKPSKIESINIKHGTFYKSTMPELPTWFKGQAISEIMVTRISRWRSNLIVCDVGRLQWRRRSQTYAQLHLCCYKNLNL